MIATLIALAAATAPAKPTVKELTAQRDEHARAKAVSRCLIDRVPAIADGPLTGETWRHPGIKIAIDRCATRRFGKPPIFMVTGPLLAEAAIERFAPPVSASAYADRPAITPSAMPKAYLDERWQQRGPRYVGTRADFDARTVAYWVGIATAKCVVRRDAVTTHALFATGRATMEEGAVFRALQPAIAACVPQGQTLEAKKGQLRALLAGTYFHIHHNFPIRAPWAEGNEDA